jgi:hypothetical protein
MPRNNPPKMKPYHARDGRKWHGLRFLAPGMAINWRRYKRTMRKRGLPHAITGLTITKTLHHAGLALFKLGGGWQRRMELHDRVRILYGYAAHGEPVPESLSMHRVRFKDAA